MSSRLFGVCNGHRLYELVPVFGWMFQAEPLVSDLMRQPEIFH